MRDTVHHVLWCKEYTNLVVGILSETSYIVAGSNVSYIQKVSVRSKLFNFQKITWKRVGVWFGLVLVGVYLFSMALFPWVTLGYDWQALQRVWYDWQALNVGIIAFGSSVIALYVMQYKDLRQRERDFIAAKAFLPSALSDLYLYLEGCYPVLDEILNLAKRDESVDIQSLVENPVPELPTAYKDVFKECIALGPPMLGDRLAEILKLLQIQNARLVGMIKPRPKGVISGVLPVNVMVEFYNLGEVTALLNKTFNFARGLGELDVSPMNLNDLKTGYINVGILFPENYEDLLEYTERRLKRDQS